MEYKSIVELSGHIGSIMSAFRSVLESLFVNPDQTINAKVILNQLKDKKIDVSKIKSFLASLPDDQWNVKVFLENLQDLNEIFGVSNQEIERFAVTNLNEKELKEVRWKLSVESMLECSKFASEFYDALKYSVDGDFSKERLKLLNQFMRTFKFLKDSSLEIYEIFKNKPLKDLTNEKFALAVIPIEYLLLRILYIAMNVENADDKDLERFSDLLSRERISVVYQRVNLPSVLTH